jgi:hypothetical protein
METLGKFLDTVLATFSPYANHDTFYNAVLPYQNMVVIIKDPATKRVLLKGRTWFKIKGKLVKDTSDGYNLDLCFINTEDMVDTVNMSNPSNPNRDLEVKAKLYIKPNTRPNPNPNVRTRVFTFFDPDYEIFTTIGSEFVSNGFKKNYPIELYTEPTPEQREEAVMSRTLAQSEFNLRPGGPEYRLQQARLNEDGMFMRNSKIPPFRTRSMPTKLKSRTSSNSRNSRSSRKSRLLAKGRKTLVTRSAELPKRRRSSSSNRNGRIKRSPVVLSQSRPQEFPEEDTNAFLVECNKNSGNVEAFLQQGMDPNFRNETNEPVLSIAAKKGNLAVVRQLLQSGADINAKDDEGNTPLMNAIRTLNLTNHARNLLDLMRTLKQASPNLKLRNNAGQNVADLLNMRISSFPESSDGRNQWTLQKNNILNNYQ